MNKNFPGKNIVKSSRNYPIVFFLLSAAIVLIILPLFQKGTFIDGMLYKAVAHNYAENLSSFWRMKFTDTSMQFFCEQPPLYFYLLGNFYKLFGNSYLTDRFFTLLLLILLVVAIHFVVKQLFKRSSSYFLLIVFFILCVPVISWSYVNQVIEPLASFFTVLGVFLFIQFLKTGKTIFTWLFFVNLYLLFLSKGFQECFIVCFPLSHFMMNKTKIKNLGAFTLAAVIFVFLLFFTTKIGTASSAWFDCYYHSRLILTIQNVGNTTDDHLEIIGRFFSELIIPLLITIILFVFVVLKKRYPFKFILKNFISNKIAVALLITAIAGSFPYAISLVQRGFYLIPAFLCFILALVYGFKRYWLFFFQSISGLLKYKPIRILIYMVFAGTMLLFLFNLKGYKRDEKLLTDLEIIKPYLAKKDTVLIENDMWNYFTLHASLYMYGQISLTTDDSKRKFMIKAKSRAGENSQVGYNKLNLNTRELDLYIRNK